MKQENLKQISIRINPDTLEKLDRLVSRHPYWKRNSVINCLLTVLTNDFEDGDLWSMLRRSFHPKNKVIAKFEITNLLNVDKK